jgi:hypothetical protein
VSEGGRTNRPGAGNPLADTANVESPQMAPRARGLFGASRMDAVEAEREEVAASLRQRLKVMRKTSNEATPTAIPEQGGRPLPAGVRSKMEPRLGADLSAVRLHMGGDSAEAAATLGARAFTVGSDVHFATGGFSPGTKEGDKLLAHELTHVVQGQRSGIQRKADDDGAQAEQGTESEVSHPDEPAEKEADAVGDKVADDLHGEKKGKAKDDKQNRDGNAGQDGPAGEKNMGGADAAGDAAGSEPMAREKAPRVGAKLAAPVPITARFMRVGRKIHRVAGSTIMRASKGAPGAPVATPASTAASKNPHAGKLKGDAVSFVKQACAGDKIAMQKIHDVEGEQDIQDVPPKTAAQRFFQEIATNINGDANLDVKHAYATAGFQQAASHFLRMGRKIDKSKIAGLCSRTVRIENWWKYNCTQDRFLKQADQVTRGRLKGKEREDLAYSLMRLELSENPGAALGTLDRSKPIQPSGMHGWFTDDKVKLESGKDAGFSQLMHIFALQPEVFAEGTVFIEIAPKGLEGEVRKPTAYDGMQSSLWVPRPGEIFGVTGGGLREFLADNVKGSAVQTATARVPSSGLAAEIKKYNADAMSATGSASATDVAVRGENAGKQGGKGKATTQSVVATTQNERNHPSPPRGPRK